MLNMVSSKRGVRILCMVLLMVLLVTSLSFAANTEDVIQDGVKEGAGRVYRLLLSVVLPIAAVALAWAVFRILYKGADEIKNAKNFVIVIIFVIGIIFAAPAIVHQIAGWFSEVGDVGIFN